MENEQGGEMMNLIKSRLHLRNEAMRYHLSKQQKMPQTIWISR